MKLSDLENETLERALFAQRARAAEATRAPVHALEAILARADAEHARCSRPLDPPFVSSPTQPRFGWTGAQPRVDRTRAFAVSVVAAACVAGLLASLKVTSVDRSASGLTSRAQTSGHASSVIGVDGAEAPRDHLDNDDGCEGRADETSRLSFCSGRPYVLASRLEHTGAGECTAPAASFEIVTRDTLTCECGEACGVVSNRY